MGLSRLAAVALPALAVCWTHVDAFMAPIPARMRPAAAPRVLSMVSTSVSTGGRQQRATHYEAMVDMERDFSQRLLKVEGAYEAKVRDLKAQVDTMVPIQVHSDICASYEQQLQQGLVEAAELRAGALLQVQDELEMASARMMLSMPPRQPPQLMEDAEETEEKEVVVSHMEREVADLQAKVGRYEAILAQCSAQMEVQQGEFDARVTGLRAEVKTARGMLAAQLEQLTSGMGGDEQTHEEVRRLRAEIVAKQDSINNLKTELSRSTRQREEALQQAQQDRSDTRRKVREVLGRMHEEMDAKVEAAQAEARQLTLLVQQLRESFQHYVGQSAAERVARDDLFSIRLAALVETVEHRELIIDILVAQEEKLRLALVAAQSDVAEGERLRQDMQEQLAHKDRVIEQYQLEMRRVLVDGHEQKLRALSAAEARNAALSAELESTKLATAALKDKAVNLLAAEYQDKVRAVQEMEGLLTAQLREVMGTIVALSDEERATKEQLQMQRDDKESLKHQHQQDIYTLRSRIAMLESQVASSQQQDLPVTNEPESVRTFALV